MTVHSVHVCRLFFCTLHMHSINFLARILGFIFSELYLKICFNIVCIALNCHIIWYFFVCRDIKAFDWLKKKISYLHQYFFWIYFFLLFYVTLFIELAFPKKHRQQNVKVCLFNYKQMKYNFIIVKNQKLTIHISSVIHQDIVIFRRQSTFMARLADPILGIIEMNI